MSEGYSPGASTNPATAPGASNARPTGAPRISRLPLSAAARREQQAEQRRLAGTVRPGQTVDPSPRHLQIDAVEGDDITETLGDPASPDREP